MAPKNLSNFIAVTQHIMKEHLGHFYTLSLIFFFPITFSILTSRTLLHLFNSFFLQQPITNPFLMFLLLYSLFLLLFSNCGVITTTYSVFHFFYGQPVKLLSAIKSIPTSFLPLLATTIVSQTIIFCISIFYWLLLVLVMHVAKLLHVTISISCSSPYIIGFFLSLPLLLVLIYLQVNWTLVPVIVVVESCWGLEPLRRSARLIRGMKRVALSSLLLYGFATGFSVLNFLYWTTENWFSSVSNWLLVALCSFLFAMIMLSNLGVSTVMYIYCKANHGEIVEEFGMDYVSLPFHYGNVSHAV